MALQKLNRTKNYRFESGSFVVVDDAEVALVPRSDVVARVLQHDVRDLENLRKQKEI